MYLKDLLGNECQKLAILNIDKNDANLMRLLISSDIHLGYAENDQNRWNDSFNAFEELLGIGVEYGVDMVILGVNLFHKW